MSEHVRLAIEGPLARITLDRPPLNILTTAMMRDLAEALGRADASAEVRLVRLDAVGKVFSAGVDVADHEGDLLRPMMDSLRSLFDAFERVGTPTVVVVHGAALGGGCEVALGADLCLASERASFGQPEIRLGVFAPPASVLLPRICGERNALDFLLGGETVPAEEARRLGIVNRVFPAETFDRDVDAYLGRLLEYSGSALRLAKRAVTATRALDRGGAQRAVFDLYLDELMKTPDANEGLRAFLEKRPPVWRHR
jgi:cyclohexa-1,5-dienecarbonyl-CoA hydratase